MTSPMKITFQDLKRDSWNWDKGKMLPILRNETVPVPGGFCLLQCYHPPHSGRKSRSSGRESNNLAVSLFYCQYKSWNALCLFPHQNRVNKTWFCFNAVIGWSNEMPCQSNWQTQKHHKNYVFCLQIVSKYSCIVHSA